MLFGVFVDFTKKAFGASVQPSSDQCITKWNLLFCAASSYQICLKSSLESDNMKYFPRASSLFSFHSLSTMKIHIFIHFISRSLVNDLEMMELHHPSRVGLVTESEWRGHDFTLLMHADYTAILDKSPVELQNNVYKFSIYCMKNSTTENYKKT